MAELSITLKLPFYRLNQVKALEFERLNAVNTAVANDLLKVDKKDRQRLTSAAFKHVEIGSMWINQTIRNTNAKTKVKHFMGTGLKDLMDIDVMLIGMLLRISVNGEVFLAL
jgi:putative transposase